LQQQPCANSDAAATGGGVELRLRRWKNNTPGLVRSSSAGDRGKMIAFTTLLVK